MGRVLGEIEKDHFFECPTNQTLWSNSSTTLWGPWPQGWSKEQTRANFYIVHMRRTFKSKCQKVNKSLFKFLFKSWKRFCFLDPFAQIYSNHKTIAIKFQDAARHCTQTRGCQRKTRAAMPQGFFLKFPAKRRDVKIGRIEQHYQIIPWETLPGGDLPRKFIHLHPLCNHQESCRICQSVNCGNRGAQGLTGCVVVIAGSSKVKPAGNGWLGWKIAQNWFPHKKMIDTYNTSIHIYIYDVMRILYIYIYLCVYECKHK